MKMERWFFDRPVPSVYHLRFPITCRRGGEVHLVGVFADEALDDVDLLDQPAEGVLVLPVAGHVGRPKLQGTPCPYQGMPNIEIFVTKSSDMISNLRYERLLSSFLASWHNLKFTLQPTVRKMTTFSLCIPPPSKSRPNGERCISRLHFLQ